MEINDFARHHASALESNEARHNLILAIIAQAESTPASTIRLWSLGNPGACAVQSPGWPIVLGELDEQQCHRLAEDVRDTDFPGVVGPDATATWFVRRAGELGAGFLQPIPQQIHAIYETPRYPGVAGLARTVTPADVDLFCDWLLAFAREATPHDRPPSREGMERAAGEGRYLFWIASGEPVSMAGLVRRTKHGAAIAGVYTPPALRGQGHAGSVTAAMVERIFSEGKSFACLYTDLRNPFSNRCYANIGFKPVCKSMHYPRA